METMAWLPQGHTASDREGTRTPVSSPALFLYAAAVDRRSGDKEERGREAGVGTH